MKLSFRKLATIEKYYLNYFNSLDVPCSEILSYKTEIDYLTGKDPLSRKVYY
jgi:hypothetical protein